MAKEHIITLLTDFGTADGYVACIKGVLLRSRVHLNLVDITHEIPHGNVMAGAFVLNQVLDYYPPGTIHVAVIDPGVGTDRRIIAARYGGQYVICPDNGLVSFVHQRLPLEQIVSVRNERYFLQNRVGITFDGRDVMAPVAAAMAEGVPLAELGPPPEKCKLLDLPEPTWDGEHICGQILYIDAFGNCVSNVSADDLHSTIRRLDRIEVSVKGVTVGPLQGAYAHVPTGQTLALLNSLNMLEVAVNDGSAQAKHRLSVGDPVCIRLTEANSPAVPPQQGVG